MPALARRVAHSPAFQHFISLVIALVGVEAFPAMVAARREAS